MIHLYLFPNHSPFKHHLFDDTGDGSVNPTPLLSNPAPDVVHDRLEVVLRLLVNGEHALRVRSHHDICSHHIAMLKIKI